MSFGSNTNALTPRMAGVKVASDGGGAERGKANIVTASASAEVLFVWHNDQRGIARLAMFFKVGDQYVTTPDTVEWCDKLRPMSEWMRKALDTKAEHQQPVDLPSDDAVDVLSG